MQKGMEFQVGKGGQEWLQEPTETFAEQASTRGSQPRLRGERDASAEMH